MHLLSGACSLVRATSPCLAAAASLHLGTAVAQDPSQAVVPSHALRPGLYEIEVSVRVPGAPRPRETRVVRRCLSEVSVDAHRAFEILTPMPAASCPRYEICTGGPRIGLQTLCEDGPQASAVGMFALDGDGFRGTVEIDREDADRALVETQYGRRIGECPDGSGEPAQREPP